MGWGKLKNGALLKAAEAASDALITTDQSLKYQQNLTGRKIAILVLPTNDWPVIRQHGEEIATTVTTLKPGDFVELVWPGTLG